MADGDRRLDSLAPTQPLSGEVLLLPELEPIRQFGPYERLELVGQGGMGSVYRAYDTRLQRTVALKFLHAASPEMRARLVHEARAQARIDDKRICRVYEVDQIEGRPYVAMQFIHGRTLAEAAHEMTTEQKVRVLAEVAEAVHSAHRAGVVHRDLKSTNVMVERTDEGDWQPYVLDFGLARETAAPGLSSTGVVMGTPAYMAPEQARGDRLAIDRRTDVYSLGVTLYEILTDALPFADGSALETLVQILQETPVPLRARVRSLPADLETIVMKCLEKEPSRRYDSARALAEDLRRFLDGEPIAAKPISRMSRAMRVVRKNRALFATLAVALVVVVIAGALALRERLGAQQRALVAQRLGREVSRVESLMRFGVMLPPHDVTREKGMIRARVDAMRRTLPGDRETAAAAHYAIGRGLYVLGDLPQARAELETAWRDGYREPEAAYALGLILGRLYQAELAQAALLRGEIRKARLEQLARELRDPSIEHLRRAEGAGAETPRFGEALVARFQDQHALALAKADQALAAVPWLHEAQRLKGDVHHAMATTARDAGDFETARREYELADAEYRRAIAMARSDGESHEGLANVWLNVMWMQVYGPGGDLQPAFEKVLASARTAAMIDPRRAQPHVAIARAWRILGEQRSTAGGNPLEAFARAREAASAAIRIDSGSAAAYKDAAVAWQSEATWKSTHGQDPRAAYAAAIENLERALKIAPDDFVASNSLGNAHLLRGQWLETIGEDPFPSFRNAVRHYEATVKLAPRYAPAYSNMGLALQTIGQTERNRGTSPVASLQAAVKAFERAVEINPKFVMAFNNLGLARHEYGKYEESRGADPLPMWNAAIASFDQATAINPDLPLPPFNRSLAYADMAEYDETTGRDPAANVRKSEEAFAAGIAKNPDIAAAYLFPASAQMALARYLVDRREPADAPLARIEELVRKSLEIDPGSAMSHQFAAEAAMMRARDAISHGRSPEGAFAAAIRAIEKALAIKPDGVSTLQVGAALHAERAEWLLRDRRDATADLRKATGYIESALKQNAADSEIHLLHGRILLVAARAANDPSLAKAGSEAVNRAVAMNANLRRPADSLLRAK